MAAIKLLLLHHKPLGCISITDLVREKEKEMETLEDPTGTGGSPTFSLTKFLIQTQPYGFLIRYKTNSVN